MGYFEELISKIAGGIQTAPGFTGEPIYRKNINNLEDIPFVLK